MKGLLQQVLLESLDEFIPVRPHKKNDFLFLGVHVMKQL